MIEDLFAGICTWCMYVCIYMRTVERYVGFRLILSVSNQQNFRLAISL